MPEHITPPPGDESLFETPESLLNITPEQAALHDELAHLTRMSRSQEPAAVIDALGVLHSEYRQSITPADPPTPITDLLGGVLDDVAHRYQVKRETGRPYMGHSTGYPQLDSKIGGLEPGRITMMMAEPGAGKTTFSNQMAYTLAANGVPVLYCSYENSPADLTMKQLARIAGKNPGMIQQGNVAPADLEGAYNTLRKTAGPRLHYLNGNTNTNPATLLEALQAIQATAPGVAPVVIVDYLHAMARASTAALGDDMRHRVGSISRLLIELAKSAGAHVWAISSASRSNGGGRGESGYGKMDMARLKESGDLEFDSDHVIALEKVHGTTSLNTDYLTLRVLKNRHGVIGDVPLERNTTNLAITERGSEPGTITHPGNGYAGAVKTGWKQTGTPPRTPRDIADAPDLNTNPVAILDWINYTLGAGTLPESEITTKAKALGIDLDTLEWVRQHHAIERETIDGVVQWRIPPTPA